MIDLYSDTLTKPSQPMRQAMARAEVADEQRREDPTTNRLQSMAADLLGKETALFLPSGSMCNAIAIRTHTQPGDSILCDRMAHIHRSEFGGPAALSGVTTELIDGEHGRFTADQLRAALALHGAYGPLPRLVCVEQTHNYGSGSIWPLEQLRAVCAVAKEKNLAAHMDGARLFNASVATGISIKDYAATFDSVWIDLSKGLGCPIGAVLAGNKTFIEKAWRYKHMFGGAMRQSGILAAAGIYALEHNVNRLADDHANAKRLADALTRIPGVSVENPQTNIVFFDPTEAGVKPADFVPAILSAGVRMGFLGGRVRAVTQLDISADDVDRAVEIIRKVLKK